MMPSPIAVARTSNVDIKIILTEMLGPDPTCDEAGAVADQDPDEGDGDGLTSELPTAYRGVDELFRIREGATR